MNKQEEKLYDKQKEILDEAIKGWKKTINFCERLLWEAKYNLIWSIICMILMFLAGLLLGVTLYN